MGAIEMGLVQNVLTNIGSPNDTATISGALFAGQRIIYDNIGSSSDSSAMNSTLFAGQQKLFETPKWIDIDAIGSFIAKGAWEGDDASGTWRAANANSFFTVPNGSVLFITNFYNSTSGGFDTSYRIIISGTTTVLWGENLPGTAGSSNLVRGNWAGVRESSTTIYPPLYVSGGEVVGLQIANTQASSIAHEWRGFLTKI